MRELVVKMSCVDSSVWCIDTTSYDVLWNIGIFASIVSALVVTLIWLARERRK
jgi:hypothetical protein